MMENRDNCPNCWWWWTISGCIKLNKQSRRNLWEGLYKKYIQNLNAGLGGTAAVQTPLCWTGMNYKNISAFWRKGHFSSTLVSVRLGMVSALKTITFWSREVAAFSQKTSLWRSFQPPQWQREEKIQHPANIELFWKCWEVFPYTCPKALAWGLTVFPDRPGRTSERKINFPPCSCTHLQLWRVKTYSVESSAFQAGQRLNLTPIQTLPVSNNRRPFLVSEWHVTTRHPVLWRLAKVTEKHFSWF